MTPRVCFTRPPTEPPQTDAFVEVDEITLARKVKRIFTGWMFAASPGLHAVDHAVYDVWLTDCKQSLPVAPPKKQVARRRPGKAGRDGSAAAGALPAQGAGAARRARAAGARAGREAAGRLIRRTHLRFQSSATRPVGLL